MSGMFEVPPEAVAAMQAQADHRQMHIQANIHAEKTWFNSLKEDELTILERIVIGCKDEETSGYYRGVISHILEVKFKVCPCGIPHADVESLLEEPGKASVEEPEGPTFDADDYFAKCEEWGVSPVTALVLDVRQQVACDECGMQFVSLADRMLRPPKTAGCQGCQHKSAHG